MNGDSLLAKLAEDFIGQIRNGKTPDSEEYAVRYPQLAHRIRELFPTLLMLEGAARTRALAAVSEQMGLAPGSIFGSYRIQREIGRGGMGIVYEAVKVLVETRVALKILPLQTPVDAKNLERFFREARITASLKHPNIVSIYDVGQVANTAYFAMQYIEGHGLDRILRLMQPQAHPSATPDFTLDSRAYQLSAEGVRAAGEGDKVAQAAGRIRAGAPACFEDYLKWVANLGVQAAAGLAYAHDHKLVHRDIKPSNLLLGRKGALWIADFGLARSLEDPALTVTGMLLGTPRYMSPEQVEANRRQVDRRSDIYSLGATLYELLTCRPVFEGRTSQEVLVQILERDPVTPRRLNPSIPEDLETVVMKAMAKRPEDRFQSAQDLADDLGHWLKTEPIKARRIGPVRIFTGWYKNNLRLGATLGVLALVLIIAGGLYFLTSVGQRPRDQRANEVPGQSEATPNKLAPKNQAPGITPPDEAQRDIRPQPAPGAFPNQPPVKAQTASPLSAGPQTQGETMHRQADVSQAVPARNQTSLSGAPGETAGRTVSAANLPWSGIVATPIRLRLSILDPIGSSRYKILQEMSRKWRDASGGTVQLSINAGGTQGGESNVVRLLQGNILTAALLTSAGLRAIEPTAGAPSSIPMVFRSWDEYDYVMSRLSPQMGKMLLDKGFMVLFWSEGGWIRLFSRDLVLHPDDLRSMRLSSWAGTTLPFDLMKLPGYSTQSLEMSEILPALRAGMIDAIPLPPDRVLTGQIYTVAGNMLSLNWGVSSEALVIKKNVWDKIDPVVQKTLLESAAEAGAQMRVTGRKDEDDAVKTMQSRGLKVNVAPPQIDDVWHSMAETAYPMIRGKIVSADTFDLILHLLAEFRAGK